MTLKLSRIAPLYGSLYIILVLCIPMSPKQFSIGPRMLKVMAFAQARKEQHDEDALVRALNAESLSFLNLQEKMKTLAKNHQSCNSMQILAQRELLEAQENVSSMKTFLDDDHFIEKKIELRENRTQLHSALISHSAFTSALQGAACNTQMQNCVHEHLRDKREDKRPEALAILENHFENKSACTEYADALLREDKLQKDILLLRLRYRTILDSVEQKWKTVRSNRGQNTQTPYNPELKKMEEKLQKRQERLELVVTLLQNLVATSGEKWGANQRVVEIMLMCDAILSDIGGSEMDLVEILKRLQVTREKAPFATLVSSTPKP